MIYKNHPAHVQINHVSGRAQVSFWGVCLQCLVIFLLKSALPVEGDFLLLWISHYALFVHFDKPQSPQTAAQTDQKINVSNRLYTKYST